MNTVRVAGVRVMPPGTDEFVLGMKACLEEVAV